MLGIGASEFVIVALIALVLFGAPILTFVLGYTMGKKSADIPGPPNEAVSSNDEPRELPE